MGLAVASGCNIDGALYMTDQKPMLGLMRRNVVLNGLQEKVKAEVLDWGRAIPATVPRTPDVILAADCVYFEPAFPLLQATLLELIGPETICYFCFKKRRRADLRFVKKVRKVLEVREVDDDPERERYSRENIFLYGISMSCSLDKRLCTARQPDFHLIGMLSRRGSEWATAWYWQLLTMYP